MTADHPRSAVLTGYELGLSRYCKQWLNNPVVTGKPPAPRHVRHMNGSIPSPPMTAGSVGRQDGKTSLRQWGAASGMTKQFSPSLANSQIQPSLVETEMEPFMAADMPEVPEASRVTTGLLSHTSEPFFR